MRSVVVLALLWQTAVVLGLGAIHAPVNNNNIRASSALPWVGTEVWSTDVMGSQPAEIFPIKGNLYIHGQDFSIPHNCKTRLVSINNDVGNEQWRGGPVGGCGAMLAHQHSFIATAGMDMATTVYAVRNSTKSVDALYSFGIPAQSLSYAIYSVGSHFFWFTSSSAGSTMTKIDPRSGASSTNKALVPQSNRFYAGLNYLFTVDQATSTLLTCLSAATGDVAWSILSKTILSVVPSTLSDVVLVVHELDGSLSLLNATNGNLMWVSPTSPIYSTENTNIFFPDIVVTLETQVGIENMDKKRFTARHLSNGAILWRNVHYTFVNSRLVCGLDSNILVVANPDASSAEYDLYGIDVRTGSKVMEFVTSMGNHTPVDFRNTQVHCSGNDVYFSTTDVMPSQHNDGQQYGTVQRIKLTPQA